MEGVVHEHDGESHTDFWGITWRKEGAFNQTVGFPLAGASRDEVLAYRFPEERIDFLLGLMAPVTAHADRFFIGCDVSPCVFEMYWRLRGMEDAMLDMAADPALARTMFARCGGFRAEAGPGGPVRRCPWTGCGAATTWPGSSPW